MALTQQDAAELATGIVISLCGSRWVYPPVRFVDEYPVPRNGMVALSGRPVVSIQSVLLDGRDVTADGYDMVTSSIMRLRNAGAGNCRVQVDYTYGVSALPPLVQRAIDVLTSELLAADAGDATCRIPERVTSVTRQGVSWTMIDPQDFMDKGRTGIYEVDMAIKAVNPGGAHRRARLFAATMSAPALRRRPS